MFLAMLVLLVAVQASAQVRMQGTVVDEDGKPVRGAKITLMSERGGSLPALTTDGKGKWAALAPIGGPWNIDVEAAGFVTSKGSMQLSEVQRTPPVKTVLQKVAVAQAQPEPEPSNSIASTVPPEAVDAVKRGEEYIARAMGQTTGYEIKSADGTPQAEITDKSQLYKLAVVEFERAQALLPENLQIKQALARAYYGAGQIKEAVSLLRQVHEADPSNTGIALLLVNLYLEDGNLEAGKSLLEKLPEGTLTDPTAVINIGILFMNKNKPREALDYLTRAVNIAPNRGESYYYRGLANVQLEKIKDAKADFEKVIQLAPESTEAADAREMLKQFK